MPEANPFVSGAVGGFSMILVSHPFDLLKTRLQTSFFPIHVTTFNQAFTHTMNENGIKGLYRGVFPVLLGALPICAVSFGGYHYGQSLIRSYTKSQKLSILQYGIAGSFSGMCTVLIITPLERVKILLQTSRSSLHTVVNTMQKQGMKQLMRGGSLSFGRDVIGNFVYFGAYEGLLNLSPFNRTNPISILMSGGLSGIACWMVIFPIDCIKSRFQSSTVHLATIISEARSIGLRSLYKGLSSTLLRAFPASAAFFMGAELGKKILI